MHFYQAIELSTKSVKLGIKMLSFVETEDEIPKTGNRRYTVFKQGAKLRKAVSS
jgi:hypothetical protein